MPVTDFRQRTAMLFIAVVLGHIILISAQVNSSAGVPLLEVITFGAFAEVQRGAAGYLLKSDTPAAIFKGIRDAFANKPAFSEMVEERLVSGRGTGAGVDATSTRLQALTPRELEVLRMIGQGLSRADIAQRLFRSLKTVDAHHTSIMRKLDIHDRAELTRYVIREGLAQA